MFFLLECFSEETFENLILNQMDLSGKLLSFLKACPIKNGTIKNLNLMFLLLDYFHGF